MVHMLNQERCCVQQLMITAQQSMGQSAGTLHSKLVADLTQYPQLLGIGLGKVAGRWGGPRGRGAASPGGSNEGQLL